MLRTLDNKRLIAVNKKLFSKNKNTNKDFMKNKSLYDLLKELAKNSPTLSRIIGADLSESNANRQLQKAFQIFYEIHNLESLNIDLNDADLHNDGLYVCFHLNPKDEFIFGCDMDALKVNISKAVDYDAGIFEDVEEFDFDWEVLATKLYQYRNVSDPRQ